MVTLFRYQLSVCKVNLKRPEYACHSEVPGFVMPFPHSFNQNSTLINTAMQIMALQPSKPSHLIGYIMHYPWQVLRTLHSRQTAVSETC